MNMEGSDDDDDEEDVGRDVSNEIGKELSYDSDEQDAEKEEDLLNLNASADNG